MCFQAGSCLLIDLGCMLLVGGLVLGENVACLGPFCRLCCVSCQQHQDNTHVPASCLPASSGGPVGLTARPEVDDSNSSAEEQAQLAANSSSKGLRQPLLPTHQQQPASSSSSQLRPHAAANPYSIHAQAHLTLRFCELLGLRRVLLVGHADGCLVAVHAAAAACRRSHPTWHAHHHHQHQPHSQQQLRYAAAAATSSGKAVQQSLTDMRLDSQGSVDFSWMGSLGKVGSSLLVILSDTCCNTYRPRQSRGWLVLGTCV